MIDAHAHHWPDGLLRALRNNVSWYGWEPVRLMDGRRVLALGDRVVRFAPPSVDLANPHARFARRADSGITAELVMPVGFLWGEHLTEHDAAGYFRELNVEMAQAQSDSPRRIRGAAMLPFAFPRLFDTELARVAGEGFHVAAVPTNVRGHNLDDHTLLPLVESVLDAGLAIALHPTYLTPVGAERFPRYYFANSFGAPLEAALALLSLVHAGLFDRRPDARVLVANGAGSAPYEIGRFAGRYRERPDVRTMSRPPDSYLAAAFYDCLVLDERSLGLLVDRVGADHVMIGTDHPFHTDLEVGAVAWVSSMPSLTPLQREQILWRTAADFLRWDDFSRPGSDWQQDRHG